MKSNNHFHLDVVGWVMCYSHCLRNFQKVNFPTKIVIITFALVMLVQNKHNENMLNQVYNQFGNTSELPSFLPDSVSGYKDFLLSLIKFCESVDTLSSDIGGVWMLRVFLIFDETTP